MVGMSTVDKDQMRPGAISAEALGRLAAAKVHELVPDADESLMDIGLNLVRASTAFIQASERGGLRGLDLRWSTFGTMFMASLFSGVEAGTLARITGVTRQAVSLVLIALEKAGRVRRPKSDPSDKRLRVVVLTDKGQHDLRKGMERQMEVSSAWFARLTQEERRELNRLLKKLLAG